ncbi:DNA replication protein DnaD [Sporotomaculum syntrophicum]|uniref:DNA replication protein DnaD n=1 Tax=Sporotomaculum syntrophicum TaxID=182264 RepID=A0A9D2WRC5_9FIRM|nr:DnaD domain protein [Sporotomaculum syntrophicum]KAF1086160.1 DNA replication protein DnaD [Sporotomaculum syntrophicum]
MSKALHSDIPPKIDMDDGYFPLARTAILTLSKTRLSGSQRSIIDVIFTQTYGYYCDTSPHEQRAKKRHTRAQISHEYFMTATWMGKQEVSRAINSLIKWRIIGREKNTSPYTYWFNVQVDDWAPDCWRVSRIANNKQNSEQSAAVPRTVSSLQDSEQLASQLTKSSQDSEPGIRRTANCSQVSALGPQGVSGILNKYINKINKNNDDDNNSGSQLAALFENELGRPLSGYEIDQLEQWSKKTTYDLLVEALKKAIQHDKFSFAYIQGILKNWHKDNVLTLADVQRHDVEFKKKGGVIRGPTGTTAKPGNAGGYPARDKNAGFRRPPNKYDSIDFSKFYFQG